MDEEADYKLRRRLDKFTHKDTPPASWAVLGSEAIAAVIVISLAIYFDVPGYINAAIDWLLGK